MDTKISIQGQTVLYCNDISAVTQTVLHFANAVIYAKKHGIDIDFEMIWGDASPEPLLSEQDVTNLQEQLHHTIQLSYRYFNKNTGTSLGHNWMAENCNTDYLLIMNPDIVVQPDFFTEILLPFLTDPNHAIGIVEGRQTPVEHHKAYDPVTMETSWGSGACTLFRTEAYKGVNGYDADTFFMYCDDVDISWRIRLQGYKIIYRPSAVVFHDKRFTEEGSLITTRAEKNYSLEARLLMAWKWSYPEKVESLLELLRDSPIEEHQFALQSFERRQAEARLPSPIDPEHTVGDLTAFDYGPMRF